MKRLFALFFTALFLVFCGCERADSVSLKAQPFAASVKVSVKDGFQQRYLMKYGANTAFYGVEDDAVDFCIQGDKCTAQCNGASVSVALPNTAPVKVIHSVLSQSVDKTVMPDSAGEYILYDSREYGEYSIKFSKDGYPLLIKVKNLGLTAVFSEV